MSTIELIFGTAYLATSLLLAVVAVLFVAVLSHLEKHHGKWIQISIIPLIAFGVTASSLLSGRSLQNAAIDLSLNTEGTGAAGTIVLRLLTVALLGACAARIGGEWLRKDKASPHGGMGLFLAFSAVFVSHNILSSIFGTQPTFIHNLFYPIVVFSAVYAGRRESTAPIITAAKVALYSMMALSLVVAVVKPDLAIQPGYKGWLPAITIRLWGVGSNANSIGPLALVALLLEYMQPTKRWPIRWSAIAITLTVFLLAQSKTVWFIGVMLLPVLAWYRIERPKRGIDMRLALAIVMLACAGLFLLFFVDPVAIWDKLSSSRAGGDVTTLSGRGQIWAIALNEWSNNPLFGYGPDIWGPAYRQSIGLQFAFSAHNQFLQSLSAAGTLGFASLTVYLWLLGFAAYRFAGQSKGVSLALFLMVALRCITETPLVLSTLFNGDFLIQVMLFMVCLQSQPINSAKHSRLVASARSPHFGASIL